MKIFKKILFVLALLILILSTTVFFYLRSTTTVYSGEINLLGLKDKVEVYYDDYGIPHVYAQNKEDLYYAFGYIHAQERLFQMEILRRIGSGRLSEILGKEFIKTDKYFRTIGLKETAEKSVENFLRDTTTECYKNVDSYLKGVNQYLKNGKTPIEFTVLGIPKEDFKPVDLYMTGGYISFSFAAGFKLDPIITKVENTLGEKYLVDLGIDYVPGTEKIPVYKKTDIDYSKLSNISSETSEIMKNLPVPYFSGSNSWVISGKRTKSGKVIFANDTHIAFSQPAVWYEAHLETPDYSIYGNFLAGVPFALVGHNRELAWGLTMFENDDVDFFFEETNSKNQYKENGNWKDLKVINETIKVKDSADFDFEIRKTANGPIINDVIDVGERMVTLNWTYNKMPSMLMQAFWQLNNSQNIDDARKGASMITAPGLNVMYGDSKGNIAWWASAKITKYKSKINTKTITESDSLYDLFQGYYSIDKNPSSENPFLGLVYSANNQPDSVNGVLYPGYYAPEARARRINYLINKETDWTIEKMKKMQTDVVSMTAVDFVRIILTNIDNKVINKSDLHREAYSKLMEWDGNHLPEMTEPVIYYRLLRKTLELAMNDEISYDKDFEMLISGHFIQKTLQKVLYSKNSVWWDNINTKDIKETRKDIFTNAFDSAVVALKAELDGDINQWKWRKVHSLEHVHLLGNKKPLDAFFNIGPFAVYGGTETINNLNFHLSKDGYYNVYYGPAMRILIDFADIENSISVIPTGQSGNFLSKYYDDQAELYNNGKYRKQMMNKEEIVSTCKNKINFKSKE